MISDPDAPLRATICREPLMLFEAVEVPSGVIGCVVEDWQCWLSFWFEGIERILCESPALADRVRRKLQSEGCDPMPDIRYMEVRRAA